VRICQWHDLFELAMGELLLSVWMVVSQETVMICLIMMLSCPTSGSTDSYCGTGCQKGFGNCKDSAKSSSVGIVLSSQTSSSRPASASPIQPVSKNARCGAGFGGQTCQGSRWGNCCSQYFYVSKFPDGSVIITLESSIC
jgi:hypothetical protein